VLIIAHDFEVCERGHIVVVESFEVNKEKGVSDFSLLQVHTHSDTTKEQGGLICTQHKKTEGLGTRCH